MRSRSWLVIIMPLVVWLARVRQGSQTFAKERGGPCQLAGVNSKKARFFHPQHNAIHSGWTSSRLKFILDGSRRAENFRRFQTA
jgi:hypothetical protein